MKLQTSLFLFLGLSVSCAYCQDITDWSYTSIWHARPSIGVNIPLTKLLNRTITDNLIDYDDRTYYLQFITATYFFNEQWGVEFNYQGSWSNKTPKRADRFLEWIHHEYEDLYYVTPSTGAEYDDEKEIILGDIERGLIGVVYRIEKKRLLLYPKLGIGVVSFYTDWGNAYLKEKNSHTILKVEYNPNDHFTIAPSFTVGYKLSKDISVNIDIMTSYYKTDITFTKTLTDMIELKQTSIETYEYKKDIFTLSLGTGLIIVIK